MSVGEDIAFSLENDCVPRSEMLGKVEEAAHTVDMDGFLEELPYDLSGGQKQKVALGGVLHNDVEILLFDEPLAALDPAMGMTAVDLIDRIYREKNKTVLIIEHRLEDVLYRHVDRIILINDGQIALDTTPDDLLRSNVLKDMGIREPLYISALKNAGCVFGPEDRLADLDELDISLYRENLVRHFEEQKPSLKNEVPSGEKLLNVDHVTFSYGDFTALKNISFRVKKGERISVIGKNGAGKSTMAKLLCGIIRPDEGTVTFRGVNCVQYSIRELGQKIGYVMQNPNQMLVKDMIRDEIQLAMKLNKFPEETIEKNAEEVLKMTDLYPMRNWPISVLSYGQRKRVTIASILSLRPEIGQLRIG